MCRHPVKLQGGFSLVELMVALLIGVVLTSGVISVFITSKNSYNLNNAVGQVQEEGRFALNTMQPLIAGAGFNGCGHIQPTKLNSFKNLLGTGDADPVYMVQYGIYGFEYTGTGIGASYTDTTGQTPAVASSASAWSPALPAELFTKISNALTGPVVKYSDILIVHAGQSNPAAILTDSSTSNVPATLTYVTTNAPAMSAGTLAVAADCSNLTSANVTAFQITSMTAGTLNHVMNSGTPGNVTTNTYFNPDNVAWPNSFFGPSGTTDSTDTVGPVDVYVFYVGKSNVDQGTSLYEVQVGSNGALSTPMEVVPGVENMQLLYGINTSGVPSDSTTLYKFETADTITSDITNTASLGGNPPTVPVPPGTPPDGAWNEVVSVRVALLVHSDNNATENNTSVTTSSGGTQALTNVTSQKFYMLGTGSADSFTYNSFADRRLRRLFQETVSVRSQLP